MQVTYSPSIARIVAMQKVSRLEQELLRMPQADIKTTHTFKPGVYERTIVVPPWTVLTGAEHRTDYLVRLEQGTIIVNTDAGMQTFVAPCEFVAHAGIKRAGFVQGEEVVWTDVYPNPDNCQDIAILDAKFYVVPNIGLADSRTAVQRDIIDYDTFLHQFGLTHAEVARISQIQDDLIGMPAGVNVELRDSPVHGKGLFAMQAFSAGEVVCPGRLAGKRTPGGRFINHSAKPNVIPVKVGDDIYAQATRDIAVNDELLVDYRDSMRVNFGLKVQGELV